MMDETVLEIPLLFIIQKSQVELVDCEVQTERIVDFGFHNFSLIDC